MTRTKNSVFASDRQMCRELAGNPGTTNFVNVYQNRRTGKIEYAAYGYSGYNDVRKGNMQLSYRIRVKPKVVSCP